MAYDKKEMETKALAAIKRHKLVFASDVVTYLPCCEATYYNMGLNELESIKEALQKERVAMKTKLRKRWLESDNPTLNVALYKLIGTDDEAHRLSGTRQQIDHTTKGQAIEGKIVINQAHQIKPPVTSEDDIAEDIG